MFDASVLRMFESFSLSLFPQVVTCHATVFGSQINTSADIGMFHEDLIRRRVLMGRVPKFGELFEATGIGANQSQFGFVYSRKVSGDNNRIPDFPRDGYVRGDEQLDAYYQDGKDY